MTEMENSNSPSRLEKGEGNPASTEVSADTSVEERSINSNDRARALPDFRQAGTAGLALLMSSDPQYNFHPSFETAATEVLLYSTRDIKRCIARLERVRKKRNLVIGLESEKLRQRERRAVWRLGAKLSAYYDLFTKLNTMTQYKQPQKSSVNGLKLWSADKFPEWANILEETDVDDLRGIWAPIGQIDRLILNVSQSRLGNALARPFVSKKQEAGSVKLQVYKVSRFLRAGSAVSFCLLVVFFQIPVALLSYHVLGRQAAVGVALGFCLLFTLFAQWLAADRIDVFYILVFAYGAIIGGNIINFEDD